jgi:hypothetical protein
MRCGIRHPATRCVGRGKDARARLEETKRSFGVRGEQHVRPHGRLFLNGYADSTCRLRWHRMRSIADGTGRVRGGTGEPDQERDTQ